jgi:hypothetical protein
MAAGSPSEESGEEVWHKHLNLPIVDNQVSILKAYLELSKLKSEKDNICIYLEASILSNMMYALTHLGVYVHTSVFLELYVKYYHMCKIRCLTDKKMSWTV